MTNKQYVETEVKIFVDDIKDVEDRLKVLGAELQKPRVYEVNIRYDDKNHTLVDRGIVLRLRRDSEVRLTYKDSGKLENGIISRFEAEVKLDDLDTMDLIFQRLGLVQSVVYEKYRTTYEYGETEIVLDELPYGQFIEIEGTRAHIDSAVNALNLQGEIRVVKSYVRLFDELRTALNLSFRDLTFENFDGIEISLDVLKHHLIS